MSTDSTRRTILVSGATGQQGGAVVRHLLKNGLQVRALTRHPDGAAAQALAALGAEVVKGDLNDRPSLDRGLAGAYGAFSVQNFYETGFDKEIEQGRTLADAAQAAGVSHFVYSSVGGAERHTGIAHFDSKWQVEEHLRASKVPATVLRPVFFMDNWLRLKAALAGGQLPQPISAGTKLQQIAVDDIGAVAALAFANPERWIGRAVELAGDELSMTQVGETFSRVLGHPVQFVQIPWDVFEKQAGPDLTRMYRWFESDGYRADIAALRREYPALETLESFVRGHSWKA
jgi:uncharacterized protein YbjT (DUF2867 family)